MNWTWETTLGNILAAFIVCLMVGLLYQLLWRKLHKQRLELIQLRTDVMAELRRLEERWPERKSDV